MIVMMTIAAWLAGVSHVPLPLVQEANAQMVAGGVAPGADDPLTRPIAASRAAEWLAPQPPEKIFGTSYLVGFGGLSVALIDTGDGLV
ncbi:MAG: MBL fold metallo-hydrolase, partial [Sphingopyxis sp.]